MNELSTALDRQQIDAAVEVEAKNLATVEDMIREGEQQLKESEARTRKYRDGIAAEVDFRKQTRSELARLRRKASIFRQAAFSLREVDAP